VKLKWSSPSTPLGIIPANRLYPPHAPNTPSPGERRLGLDRGVVTWDGSFLAAPLVAGDDTALQFGGAQKDFSLSTVNAARLIFQNLSAQRAAKVEPGRSGVLLVNGDFVDGEFKGLERGRVKLSSVLFGLKFFDANYEVVAVILREPAPGAPTFRVKVSDGSVLLVKKFAITPEGLTIEDATLRGYKVPAQELVEVRQGSGTNLFSASLQLGPQSLHAQAAKVDAAAEREWKSKAEAVRNVVIAENDKRARMDAEEERKIRTEVDAVTEADRAFKSAVAKLTDLQEALAKARKEVQEGEAKAEELRALAKQATTTYEAKVAETDKLKAQHDKQKGVLSQRGQEFLALTQLQARTTSRLNSELSTAEAALNSARRRLEQVKSEETARLRNAETARKAASLAAEQSEAARAKVESAWKTSQGELQLAATARDTAKQHMATAKELVDKLTRDQADLSRRAASEKSITPVRLAEAKTALDRANTDFTTKSRNAEEARVKRDRLQSEEATRKRDLDRLIAETAVKVVAAKAAQTAHKKTEGDLLAVRTKAEEELKQADMRLGQAKAAREKQLAELAAQVKQAETVRKDLEKEYTDLWNNIMKLARDRDQLKQQASIASSTFERANLELTARKRVMTTAESNVAQAMEKKLATEKLLATARAAIEQRARAQFK